MSFPTPQGPNPHDPSLSSPSSPAPAPSPSTPSARHYQQQQQHQQQYQQQYQQAPVNQYPPQPQQHQIFGHHQQQQQQQQQHIAMMNGMNGTNMAAGMPVPTPAGHQAELNYIYGMVEELSRQLAENRRVTEDIVSGLGRVRNRARTHGVNNQQIIEGASDEINGQEQNIDALISLLTESLEKAKFSRDANAKLLSQYASAMANLLRQFHEYKTKHVSDVASWHRSYRKQLSDAREENARLREQIWQMQAHAGRANESLREFRCKYDEDEARWNRLVDEKAVRQELRFWKRMAMPELEDDDPYWSDDDDIIDPAEKDRLRELDLKAAQEQLDSQAEDSDGQGPPPQLPLPGMGIGMSMMGGIAMQREDSAAGHGVPVLPPRPLSAASSTGSTGQ
ncbi:hypothetical protein NW754_005604 [Fusarium falciforme]|uniref:Uncharacterized protein n=1 Tax=Fusarium falciforme TaxID=195108 RepID=A0A9W8R4K2_9HYPO|nr:hypothetical protein NW754_005604 [Fusarium falciforme]KAJ4185234.1 hypothetical protein NW755_008678 [Fusarium falciforme]KAJ4251147.1 hypothetical protein NW757_006692 [Fusarium falciforme]